MKTQKLPAPAVRFFVAEAPPVLRAHFRDDSCLNATRVFLEVMRAFHVRAHAVSVDCRVMNRAYAERLATHGPEPVTNETALRWADAGAWALATADTTRDPNGWAGHLVALAQDAWLVDASARQFNRPARDIHVPEIVMEGVTPEFRKGRATMALQSDNGAWMMYRARLADRSFEALAGFERSPHNLEAAAEITDRIAAAMKR